jgi:ribosomal protein S18 acetylase RimI-like enzyme
MATVMSIDTGAPLTARRITLNDAAALTRMRLALLEETGGELDAAEHAALLQSNEAFFRAHMADSAWSHWCVEQGGAMVAVGTLAILERPPYPGNPQGMDAYLLNIYTVPEFRGRGAANAIVAAALVHAQACGVRKLILHATEAGRRMYEKLGFLASSAYMEISLNPTI